MCSVEEPLRRVDARLDHLAAVLGGLRDDFQTRSAALCKQRNSLTPVNILPTEVLLDVLRRSVQSTEDTEGQLKPDAKIRRLMEMSVVCTRWWNVLAEDPSLWTEVDLKVPGAELAVQRSGDQPLDIHALLFERDDTFQKRTEAISLHAKRWQSVKCYAEGTDYLEPILSSSALPLLEILNMGGGSSHIIHIHDAPNLRDLCLDWIYVRWERVKLPKLTCLTLTTIHPNVLPPVADLVQILTLFPTLKIFKLDSIKYTWYEVPLILPSTTGSLVLPNLEVLGLTNIEAPIVIHFLTRIIAKNLRSLSFGSSSSSVFDAEEAFATLSRGDPSDSLVLDTLLKNGEGAVRLTVEACALRVNYGVSQATITFAKTRPLYSIDKIISAIHLDLIQSPLHLRIETYWDHRDLKGTPFTVGFLDRLPTLTRLEDVYVSRIYVLEHLASPHANGQFPCPLLDEIHLDPEPSTIGFEYFCHILRALRKLIANRPQVCIYDGSGTMFREGLSEFMGQDIPSEEAFHGAF